MKTLGRILIILTAFALVMGLTYVVVSATSSSTNAPAFERRGEGFTRPDGQFPGGARPEFRGEGRGGGGWVFGMVKNIGIVAVIVALIAVPKDLMRRKVNVRVVK